MSTVSAARYLGTTGRHLAALSRTDRVRAVLDPRALFPRRGNLSLFANRIVLDDWADDAAVTVHATEVATIDIAPAVARLRRAELRPVALVHRNGETLYLLINQRWLPARNDNVRWASLLGDWLRAAR
ncbi:MAG TPA: hypothetical protein VG247_09565 [Pseudonocardiaceae bacterium]|nr:hypothetical protein [Pseudonocardiaceae bacterium]